MESHMEPRVPSYNIIIDYCSPGASHPDQLTIVSGHIDSWVRNDYIRECIARQQPGNWSGGAADVGYGARACHPPAVNCSCGLDGHSLGFRPIMQIRASAPHRSHCRTSPRARWCVVYEFCELIASIGECRSLGSEAVDASFVEEQASNSLVVRAIFG